MTSVSELAAVDGDPLKLTITSITPSALQPGEPLRIRGRVTNVDDEVWETVNAYLAIPGEPLTERAQLAEVAAGNSDDEFGDRIATEGDYAQLGDLAPGEFVPLELLIPWQELEVEGVGAAGVYAGGVQVLATDVDGSRDTVARVRTFLPLAEAQESARVRLAMVWPLTGPVLRRADGTYANARRLVRAMSPEGRLRRMVELGAAAGNTPLTVVPDVAVLDAAADIGAGSFGPVDGIVRRGDAPLAAPESVPEVQAWLGAAQELARQGEAWSTWYGEPDLDLLGSIDPSVLGRISRVATRNAQQRLIGPDTQPLALPDEGMVGPAGLASLSSADPDPTVVLAAQMLPDWEPVDGTRQQVPSEQGPVRAVIADPALAAGGPDAGERRTALQMRQRLLAETALLSLEAAADGRQRVSATFMAPPTWNPGADWASSGFFTGLAVPWLEPVSLGELPPNPRVYAERMREVVPVEPDPEVLAVARAIHRRSLLVVQLVGGGGEMNRWYQTAAVLTLSEAAAVDGTARSALSRRTADRLGRVLGGVRLVGPGFVTLSGSEGRFPLTVANRLDRPVRIGVRVSSVGDGLGGVSRFQTGPAQTIGPDENATVPVDSQLGQTGVTAAEAVVVTEAGRRVGAAVELRVRTSVVGNVIWAIIAVACAALVVSIVRRVILSRRSRRDGSTTDPHPEHEPERMR